jgi:hypothetical protein
MINSAIGDLIDKSLLQFKEKNKVESLFNEYKRTVKQNDLNFDLFYSFLKEIKNESKYQLPS